MIHKLYQEVSLKRDVPGEKLCVGDIATLVDFIDHPSGGEQGCILEVFNAVGESIALVTVPCSAVEPLRADEVLSVRSLSVAS